MPEVAWDGVATWYEAVGDLTAAGRPVVICHGGPGLTHDYLLSLKDLAEGGRACVFYDQVGNGLSTHDIKPGIDLYVRELEALVEHLGIGSGFHLLGHSWGAMLALELVARRRPAGLRSIVAAGCFASSATYRREVRRLVDALPAEVREAIEAHERAGTTGSAEYTQAVREFYIRHVIRTRPVPEELMRTLAAMQSDPRVYHAMCGASEFALDGVLRDWDITAQLGDIRVPTLLVSGRHDEVTPAAVNELYRALPQAKWELFEDSSHMPHLEEHNRFVAVVNEFLRAND